MGIIALAGGALLLARAGRPTGSNAADGGEAFDDPQAAVAALLQAQRDGDAEACRQHLAGAALQAFDARRQSLPSSQFAAELRSALVDLKGHATTDLNQSVPDAATLVLELIFADRKERQQIELRRIEGAWKITRRTAAGRITPQIPYGTPLASSIGAAGEP